MEGERERRKVRNGREVGSEKGRGRRDREREEGGRGIRESSEDGRQG